MPRRTDRRHIFVKRYKTIMCRSLETSGMCQYGHDCLFAHCEKELRTEEENVADGVTGEVIANWVAEKKRLDAMYDVVLPDSQRSDSSSPTTYEHTLEEMRERPTHLAARQALGNLWRSANRHMVPSPIKPPSRRRARNRAIIPAPTRDPYACLGDSYIVTIEAY